MQLGAITSNFVFEAVKGGLSETDNLGDICIDNIHVRSGLCCKLCLGALDNTFIFLILHSPRIVFTLKFRISTKTSAN